MEIDPCLLHLNFTIKRIWVGLKGDHEAPLDLLSVEALGPSGSITWVPASENVVVFVCFAMCQIGMIPPNLIYPNILEVPGAHKETLSHAALNSDQAGKLNVVSLGINGIGGLF